MSTKMTDTKPPKTVDKPMIKALLVEDLKLIEPIS